jgi:hypothetical protein
MKKKKSIFPTIINDQKILFILFIKKTIIHKKKIYKRKKLIFFFNKYNFKTK